jgi:hypothetical protein
MTLWGSSDARAGPLCSINCACTGVIVSEHQGRCGLLETASIGSAQWVADSIKSDILYSTGPSGVSMTAIPGGKGLPNPAGKVEVDIFARVQKSKAQRSAICNLLILRGLGEMQGVGDRFLRVTERGTIETDTGPSVLEQTHPFYIHTLENCM